MATLKQGDTYMGGIVQFDSATGQRLGAGQSTYENKDLVQSPTGAITPRAMEPAQPIVPVTTKPTPLPEASLQSQIDAINTQYATPLPNDAEIQTERGNLQTLISELYGGQGEQATRAQLEADPALQAKRQQVLDLSSRAQALQNEQLAIPLQIQQDAQAGGANVTKGGLQPIQTAALRNNAIQSLSVGSLLSAAQGNLSLALDQVDRAVKAKFEPMRNELEARRANLELLMSDPSITREEKRRADIASAKLNWQESQQKKSEADMKSKLDLAAKLGGFGVSNDILSRVQGADSFEEAMAIALPYLQSPESKLALENSRLENILRQEQIATERKQRGLMGQPTEAETKAEEKARLAEEKATSELSSQAKAQLPSLNAKINTLANIPTHKGLAGSVGAYGISRFTPLTPDKGARQDFKATIHQLTSELTLDNLINAKAKGATFGALSEGELGLLAKSASKINDWEVKDEKGNGTGVWEIDEASFLAEVAKIKEFAELDKAKKSGQIFTPDERSVLDQLFSAPSSAEISNFDPSYFY